MKIASHSFTTYAEHTLLESSTTSFSLGKFSFGNMIETEQSGFDDIKTIGEKLKISLVFELLQALGREGGEEIKNYYGEHEDLLRNAQKLKSGVPTEAPVSLLSSFFESVQKFSEKIETKIQGKVYTEDGREIVINADLRLSQSFYAKIEKSAAFIDPLVITFDGKLPELDGTKFSFDIDCDGEKDQISRLVKGSGFLALDRDGNGKIDDGSELFGTKSGDGFEELRTFDEDGNEWIDSGDSVFDRLRIWSNDEGESRLIALGEAGIGAIYLGGVNAEFGYRSSNGAALGQLRKSGVFLYEDGRIGNVSQVDFAKEGESSEGFGLKSMLEQI